MFYFSATMWYNFLYIFVTSMIKFFSLKYNWFLFISLFQLFDFFCRHLTLLRLGGWVKMLKKITSTRPCRSRVESKHSIAFQYNCLAGVICHYDCPAELVPFLLFRWKLCKTALLVASGLTWLFLSISHYVCRAQIFNTKTLIVYYIILFVLVNF